jgi:hypothetical protein
MRSDIVLDQEVKAHGDHTKPWADVGEIFISSATSEGHKNGTKTEGCQIDHLCFAASNVFCLLTPG